VIGRSVAFTLPSSKRQRRTAHEHRKHHHLSELRPSGGGNHADGCLPVVLRLQRLRRTVEADARPLLRLLFLWLRPVSTRPGRLLFGRRAALIVGSIYSYRTSFVSSAPHMLHRNVRSSWPGSSGTTRLSVIGAWQAGQAPFNVEPFLILRVDAMRSPVLIQKPFRYGVADFLSPP
jgi:hypothetical protein